MSTACPWPELLLWHDPLPRDGPSNMAVDEWLLERCRSPVLRIYRWQGEWVSIGCFTPWAEVETAFGQSPGGPAFVRRWTAGGIVDHRGDWTYSLIVPPEWLAPLGRPRQSYLTIHRALAAALAAEGQPGQLAPTATGSGSQQCFQHPVANDLVAPDGHKLAGAAQRRTKHGLLHQGSVRVPGSSHKNASPNRGAALARGLAASVTTGEITVPAAAIRTRVDERYGRHAWLHRY